jgi:Flp pilus assembly pilin Flp
MSQEIRVEVRPEQEQGQTMAEYTVVLGVITIAIVATIATLSDGIRALFQLVVALL